MKDELLAVLDMSDLNRPAAEKVEKMRREAANLLRPHIWLLKKYNEIISREIASLLAKECKK